MKGLFINSPAAHCSIHESGMMIYNALKLKHDIDYLEIDRERRIIPGAYDYYAFNYDLYSMNWLDTKSIRQIEVPKIEFVLEVAPNNPFVLTPDVFDRYCCLDPTMHHNDLRVYAFPRPLENYTPEPYIDGTPVIGTFGFMTPGKGFYHVVNAVNKEFDSAIVRINIPRGTFLYCRDYESQMNRIISKLKALANPGIEVVVSQDYLKKTDLIEWCGENTLNVFLYTRNQPGLSATTDQAVSSGRPLAVSTNETFRHILEYIEPYPFRSLQGAIDRSGAAVRRMQRDWTQEAFSGIFSKVLDGISFDETNVQQTILLDDLPQVSKMTRVVSGYLVPFVKNNVDVFMDKHFGKFKPRDRDGKKILIISHPQKRCGVHQYGLDIAAALATSKKYNFVYCECGSRLDYLNAMHLISPAAVIFNYYSNATMPWLEPDLTKANIPFFGIMHEVTQENADNADRELFDWWLCPDPTLTGKKPICFTTPRLIPKYLNFKERPEIPTIGSFGFGFCDKGFETLVEMVCKQYDEAVIRLHIPFNDLIDRFGNAHAKGTAKRCRNILEYMKRRNRYENEIRLEIDHKFFTKPDLLDFLAGNSLNAFLYTPEKNLGISSVIDSALAVNRPIAITRAGMFRHLAGADIHVEDRTLPEIEKSGVRPLMPYFNQWCEEKFVRRYEDIMDVVNS